MTYTVTLRFQFPAWDEKDGIQFDDICASSKKDAIAIAKSRADRDGHLGGGKGRYSFKAVEAD